MAENYADRGFSLPFWTTRNRRPTSGRAAPLAVERLESRDVPSVSANEVFVSSLYQGLLGRLPDRGGLSDWVSQLRAGESRAQVTLGIERSDEFIGRAVQIYYQDFLGRTADIPGLNYWVETVRCGGTLEEVKANILGSDEFFADNGGTMSDFLNAVYKAELGRSVDPTGLAYWSSITPNDPAGRAVTASMIIRSVEGEEVEIGSITRPRWDGRPTQPVPLPG